MQHSDNGQQPVAAQLPEKSKNEGKEVPSATRAKNEAEVSKSSRIRMHIVTDPSNADVYIAGKHVGQSLLNILLDRHKNHMIQFSKNGYYAKFTYLNTQDFVNKESYSLEQTLKLKK